MRRIRKRAFAGVLKNAIAQSGLGVKDIAAMTGIPAGTIWRWTSGASLPTLPRLLRLTEVLADLSLLDAFLLESEKVTVKRQKGLQAALSRGRTSR